MREDLRIGFIGNPNCGKTTLFNAFTGAKLKVANWPGVTVEKVEGAMKYHGHELNWWSLPGILQPDFLYDGGTGVQAVYSER